MGLIEATDLRGTDTDTALRVIAAALTIAPRLDDLPTGRNRDMAVAILTGIAKSARPRNVAAQRTGGSSVNYSIESLFSDEDRASLRYLCGVLAGSGGPIGSFPPAGALTNIWPDETISSLRPNSDKGTVTGGV